MDKSNDVKWGVYPVDLILHVVSEFCIDGEYQEEYLKAVFSLVDRLKGSQEAI